MTVLKSWKRVSKCNCETKGKSRPISRGGAVQETECDSLPGLLSRQSIPEIKPAAAGGGGLPIQGSVKAHAGGFLSWSNAGDSLARQGSRSQNYVSSGLLYTNKNDYKPQRTLFMGVTAINI
jgi:hypothetical protein